MANLQEVFNRIQQSKKEQKKIKAMYRDALINSARYTEVKKQYETLREEKKKIEQEILMDFRSELEKLDEIKTDLDTDNLLLSDLALNELTQGNMVEVVDEASNKYEPVFNVKFKKTGALVQEDQKEETKGEKTPVALPQLRGGSR